MNSLADMRTSPPGSDLRSVLARIDQRRHALVLSDRATSLAAGLSADALRNIRRQFREGDQSGLREETKRGLARALLTSVEWLMTGVGPEDYRAVAPPPRPRVQGLVVVGQVSAGRWLEDYAPDEPVGKSAIPFDPRYPVDWQYAFLIRGTSINRIASDGDFLVCLDIARCSSFCPTAGIRTSSCATICRGTVPASCRKRPTRRRRPSPLASSHISAPGRLTSAKELSRRTYCGQTFPNFNGLDQRRTILELTKNRLQYVNELSIAGKGARVHATLSRLWKPD